ncbi:hypothetical protein [Streptomyces sp. NPDC048603]|uniref:hypothetical protein n=1 Tax=Streptomyces sp. NPDC048603 TaxID=3365577 RepID=UPI0037171F2A
MTSCDNDDDLLSAMQGADSPSWSVRAAAGRRLAAGAEQPEAAAVLHRLLLDAQDTAVTRATAEALLARWDVCGLRLVLAALARADAQTGDWLEVALYDVCRQSEEDLARLERLASELVSDPDPAIAGEALRLAGRP